MLPRPSLRTKILLAMGFIALLVAGAITATDYHFRRQELLSEFQSFVRSVAGTCALAISGDDLRAIHDNADAQAPPSAAPQPSSAKSAPLIPWPKNESN